MQEFGFKSKRLCVGPVKNGPVAVWDSGLVGLLDEAVAEFSFVILGGQKDKGRLLTFSTGGDKFLSEAAFVVFHDACSTIKDLTC